MGAFDQFGAAQAGNGQGAPNQQTTFGGAPGFNLGSWGNLPPNIAAGLQQFLAMRGMPQPQGGPIMRGAQPIGAPPTGGNSMQPVAGPQGGATNSMQPVAGPQGLGGVTGVTGVTGATPVTGGMTNSMQPVAARPQMNFAGGMSPFLRGIGQG
jgi:hypothetical protein